MADEKLPRTYDLVALLQSQYESDAEYGISNEDALKAVRAILKSLGVSYTDNAKAKWRSEEAKRHREFEKKYGKYEDRAMSPFPAPIAAIISQGNYLNRRFEEAVIKPKLDRG